MPPSPANRRRTYKLVFSKLETPLRLGVTPSGWELFDHDWTKRIIWNLAATDDPFTSALHTVLTTAATSGWGELREVVPDPAHTRADVEDLLRRTQRQLRWVLRRQAQANEQLHALAKILNVDVRVPRMVNAAGDTIKWSRALLDGAPEDDGED